MVTTEPTITSKGRGFNAEYQVGEPYYEDAERGTVTDFAVLSVTHFGRPPYFGASGYSYDVRLDRESRIEREGYTIRKRTIGVGRDYGVLLKRVEDARRYSAKTARALLDEAVQSVTELRDEDPRVAAIFGEEE